MQTHLLSEGLEAATALTSQGVVKLPYRWFEDDWRLDPLGWTRRRADTGVLKEPSGDTRSGRSDEPRYQTEADRIAAAAVSEADQCLVCLGLG